LCSRTAQEAPREKQSKPEQKAGEGDPQRARTYTCRKDRERDSRYHRARCQRERHSIIHGDLFGTHLAVATQTQQYIGRDHDHSRALGVLLVQPIEEAENRHCNHAAADAEQPTECADRRAQHKVQEQVEWIQSSAPRSRRRP
jgi:UDP-2,3-diacylglucosamine pyrophosphatase LpxH